MKVRPSLTPLSWLYSGVIQARNLAFDKGLLKQETIGLPVISIGNISVGGTGKTPFTMHLIEGLKSYGKKVGIVSRGYGGNYQGVVKVSAIDPELFGDEASLYFQRFPNLPIYLCRQRSLAAEQLYKNENVDLIIADDAFQHRYLSRTLDIVLLDATLPLSDYQVLPAGPLREPFSNLVRANIVVINRANLVTRQKLDSLSDFVRRHSEYKNDFVILNNHVSKLTKLNGEEVKESDFPRHAVLASGIGQPEGFKKLVSQSGIQVLDSLAFSDHRKYNQQDVDSMIQHMKTLNTDRLLTTTKDAVKLRAFESLSELINVVHLGLSIQKGEEWLYEQITSQCI